MGTTAASRYSQLKTSRSPVEQRARDVSRVTIPSLFPPEGTNDASLLPQPWQSVGARGVNNLSAKLLLALLPPGAAFFRLEPSEDVLKKLAEGAAQGADVRGMVESALSKVENSISTRLESTNLRPILSEVLKHLIVAGNALLVEIPGLPKKKLKFKFFPLSKYCVSRDLDGELLEVVTCEGLSYNSVPDTVREAIEAGSPGAMTQFAADPTKTIELYTWVRRTENGWSMSQEALGVTVGEPGTFPLDKMPYFPLRWAQIADSDYGRGHGEEYLGDLLSAESLSQSMVEGSQAMAKVLLFRDPSAIVSRAAIKKARNLDVLEGSAKEVTVLQMEKAADFTVTQKQLQDTIQRLEQGFMLTSSIQRNAERVTAEEIRVMAGELEQALGGVYSSFSQELQLPIVIVTMAKMQGWGEVPQIPPNTVEPQIITGLEGLGRTSDLARLTQFVGLAAQTSPQALPQYLNVSGFLTRLAAALSMDTDGLIHTEEEVQAAQQAAQKVQTAQALGPHAIDAAAKRDVATIQAGKKDPNAVGAPAPPGNAPQQ